MRLLSFLRRGDIVAVQGDRPRATGRSCEVEIFDRPLRLPVGPAALARAAGVVLLPAFVFRRGRHSSQVVFRPPVRVTESGRAGLAAAMAEISGHVEWAIRQEPHQWFCFRDLWPKMSVATPVEAGNDPHQLPIPAATGAPLLDEEPQR